MNRGLRLALVAAALVVAGASTVAEAHEFSPGLLRVEAEGAQFWRVTWRGSRAPLGASATPVMPEACAPRELVPGRSWRLECAQDDLHVNFSGAVDPSEELLVSFTPAPGEAAEVSRVGEPRAWRALAPVGDAAEAAPRAWPAYLSLGVEHILLGFDHLAFVLGLLFLVGGLRRLVATLTAFTVAHSLTLAAAVLGWVEVPSAPIEATIALSVVFVARAALLDAEASRAAFAFAFAFGLLHGLGFAGALSDIGLPAGQVPQALLTFNVGVELGQLAVVAAALGASAAFRRAAPALTAAARTPAVYGLGVVAAVWTLERVAMVGGWR